MIFSKRLPPLIRPVECQKGRFATSQSKQTIFQTITFSAFRSKWGAGRCQTTEKKYGEKIEEGGGNAVFSAHVSLPHTHNLNAWNKTMICVISASELKKLPLHDVINNYY